MNKYILTSGIEYTVPERFLRIKNFRYELGGDQYHNLSAGINSDVYICESSISNRFEIMVIDRCSIDEDWKISILIVQSERFHMVVHSEEVVRFLEEFNA
jgi:hypothetical protein